ncbi:insulinase family protein [Rickettsiales endosymbiont of Peranema trichophorum]|uniref:M16 family metallopeptidase n=1 Tax=Rickettsiales endosymbiont of Peranema trichophorum TaxID=2486577 RepID=UPI0010239048|nr:pitrilysin family protein [Rickettsiales endosymbiont of Peranema trichophorum]RZI47289.1 insulinase family protein [Rickettsiales endosymbiont of Peranema trichophorum]
MNLRILLYQFFTVLALVAFDAAAEVNVQEITTKSGIKAWLVQSQSNILSLRFAFKGAGGVSEKPGLEGATTFLAKALNTVGTKGLSRTDLTKKLENMSSSVSFSADIDHFYGDIECIQGNTEDTVSIASQLIYHPVFKQQDIDEVRRGLIASFRRSKARPGYLLGAKLNLLTSGPNHRYSSRPTEKSYKSISVSDLLKHMKMWSKDNLELVIVGNVTSEKANEIIDALFKDLPSKSNHLSVKNPVMTSKRGTYLINYDMPQSIVDFAHEGVDATSVDSMMLRLIMKVLGGGISSRLGKELREKRGLVYSIDASCSYWNLQSSVDGSLETDNSNVGEVIEEIKKQWEVMKSGGMTSEELEHVKSYTIGYLAVGLTNSKEISRYILGLKIFDFSLDYLQNRRKLVESITLEQINDAASRLLKPESLIFVVVGSPKDLKAVSVE